MTDAEISRRLALAIGWEKSQIRHLDDYKVWCCDSRGCFRVFDYRDPAVIWPIAERYNCFPEETCNEKGAWRSWPNAIGDFVYSDTAAKAVALAVIKAHEGAKE